MRILGIDPGLQRTGFGLIDVEGPRLHYVASGTIATAEAPRGDLPARLKIIVDGIGEVVRRYAPGQAVVEIVFVNVNPQSTLLLGQARGAALAALVAAGLPVAEYTALQMKKSVVGHGLAAKAQIQAMVQRLLALPGLPGPDAADALGLAITHAHAGSQLAAVAAQVPRATRTRRGAFRGGARTLTPPAKKAPRWRGKPPGPQAQSRQAQEDRGPAAPSRRIREGSRTTESHCRRPPSDDEAACDDRRHGAPQRQPAATSGVPAVAVLAARGPECCRPGAVHPAPRPRNAPRPGPCSGGRLWQSCALLCSNVLPRRRSERMSADASWGLSTCSAMPIARMRAVYRLDEVEKRLDKLPPREHETLRATYERMLEKGGERFQVKPGGLPAMEHLYDELPNFHAVLDDVRRQLALCHDSPDALELTPMLLLGPPGIGKTHFARALAQLLGTGLGFISMSSLTAGWVLSGASSQWKGARPGKVFETLVDGAYANPVMVVDEIDKARAEHAYDPLGALYSLLEHDTAGAFTDEFAEVAIDASQLIWVATANDERAIPEPILNRMNVFEIEPPDADAARAIALRLYRQIRGAHDWGRRFDEEPSEAVLEQLAAMAPREMRRAWMTAFGNARLAGRDAIEPADLPGGGPRRAPIGFMQ